MEALVTTYKIRGVKIQNKQHFPLRENLTLQTQSLYDSHQESVQNDTVRPHILDQVRHNEYSNR